MQAKSFFAFLLLAVLASPAVAQQAPTGPVTIDVYCSGMVTTDAVPTDTYLITGEQSNYKVTFQQGDLVYINKGSSQGVNVGDEFLVSRHVKDPAKYKWFSQQPWLLRAMGKVWADLGRLRLVHVDANVSTAEIVYSCDWLERGDIVQPFRERPVPQYKQANGFNRFAPVSGRPVGMVVTMKEFSQSGGAGNIVYVNLGNSQGVKVGDYMRVFRYQGVQHETAFQTRRHSFRVYGFGSMPLSYNWESVPREILGEGIVLRVTPNATTLLITLSLREVYAGDYVEIE